MFICKEDFYTYFEDNDDSKISKNNAIEDYTISHNKEGIFAGDLEHSTKCKIYYLRIIIFIKGYNGLNL